MIYMHEIIPDESNHDIDDEHISNIMRLHYVCNYIRRLYARPMYINSGYRSKEDHLRIYREKGIDPKNVPMGSCHLIGAAVDFRDKDGELKGWFKSNIKLIEKLDVYFEDFSKTSSWTHLQILPPKSGNRFFYP